VSRQLQIEARPAVPAAGRFARPWHGVRTTMLGPMHGAVAVDDQREAVTGIVDLRAFAARRRGQGAPPRAAPRPRWHGWAGVVAIVLGVAGLLFAWGWAASAPARALRALPAPQRAVVLSHALDALRTVCDPAPPRSLRAFCRQQAEVALAFRECDAACREVARRNMTYATR
jgi:hypothetical protein